MASGSLIKIDGARKHWLAGVGRGRPRSQQAEPLYEASQEPLQS